MRLRDAKKLHGGDEVTVKRERHGAPDYEGPATVSSVERYDGEHRELFLNLTTPDGQYLRSVSHVHVR